MQGVPAEVGDPAGEILDVAFARRHAATRGVFLVRHPERGVARTGFLKEKLPGPMA